MAERPNAPHLPDAGAARAVLVVGMRADRVADRVAELRARGRRASGFVGDDLLAAEAMAAELFGAEVDVEQV